MKIQAVSTHARYIPLLSQRSTLTTPGLTSGNAVVELASRNNGGSRSCLAAIRLSANVKRAGVLNEIAMVAVERFLVGASWNRAR